MSVDLADGKEWLALTREAEYIEKAGKLEGHWNPCRCWNKHLIVVCGVWYQTSSISAGGNMPPDIMTHY